MYTLGPYVTVCPKYLMKTHYCTHILATTTTAANVYQYLVYADAEI